DKSKALSFTFPGCYDNHKTLIIDPWVTAVTTLPNTNAAFDVDYDYQGNTFIYGGPGSAPNKIAMYNSTGALQWTFGGVVATISWSNTGSVSNFVVNKYNSKSYTGQGVVTPGARIIRIDGAGNYDNFVSTPNGQYTEIRDLTFNCSGTETLVLGGSTAATPSGASMN